MDFAGLIGSFGGTVWTILTFVVAIVIIVTVHEFGHYIIGRWSGIHAEVFSVGFGQVIYSRTDRHGTRWQIAAIPLGGYVRFMGDADAASVRPDPNALQGLTEREKRHTMSGAPIWARSATVIAGPAANFLLAFVLFLSVILWKGVPVDLPLIGALRTVPFATPSLMVGDLITAIDGQATPNIASFFTVADTLGDKPSVSYQITRAGKSVAVQGPNPLPPFAESVQPQSAAMDAGIVAGDVVLKADGKDIASFSQLPDIIEATGGKPVVLTLWRAGKTFDVTLTPRRKDYPTADGGFDTRWMVGVAGGVLFQPVSRQPAFLEASSMAFNQGWYLVKMNATAMGYMIAGKISSCGMSGPIGMAKVVGAAARSGWETFVQTLALISLSVGILNLIPIPVLDGGHLVFHLWEAATGKPPSARALQVLMTVGVALLGALMVFALTNDLFRCT